MYFAVGKGIIRVRFIKLCMSKTSLLDVIKNASKVAVIGASRHPEKVGFQIVKNIQTLGFPGELFLVNPDGQEILGIQCVTKIKEIPGIDVAVLAVHPKATLEVAKEVLKKGAKTLIVISSGFRESSKKGSLLEEKLAQLCERNGARLIGPNCMGLIAPHEHLNLSFAHSNVRPGNIAFLSQSGALVSALLDWSWPRYVGFSWLVSLGNEADVNINDMLQALQDDDRTEVIGIYAEQITDGKEFIRIAKQVANKKRIFLLKGGQTHIGAKTALSHTGAMVNNQDVIEAACYQAGIILHHDTESFFQALMLSAWLTMPKDPALFVVSNAGGPAVTTVDQIVMQHLPLVEVTEIPAKWQQKYPHIPWQNPLDLVGDARQERYADAIYLLGRQSSNMVLFILLTPQSMTDVEAIAQTIKDFHSTFPKQPIMVSFMGGKRVEEGKKILYREHIPCFEYPEQAITLFAQLANFETPSLKMERISVKKKWKELLLPVQKLSSRQVPKLTYPVVLKGVTPKLYHKTEMGGVALNIPDEKHLLIALKTMQQRLKQFAQVEYQVTPYIAPGRELLMSVKRDTTFGMVLTIALGGIWTEALHDKVVLVAPCSRYEIKTALRGLKSYKMFTAFRDEPDIVGTVVEIALLLVKELEKRDDLSLIELNPVRFVGKKAYVLDWKEQKN